MRRRGWIAAGCLALVGCAVFPGLVARGDAGRDGGGNAAAPLAADSAARLVADAKRLQQPDNAGRLDALQGLLHERQLAFQLQTVPNPMPAADPRPSGQNVVIGTVAGSGVAGTGREILLGAHFDAARTPDGSLSAGMVDNAAAVVVLVDIAAKLPRLGLRHPVRVLLFDLEELGLIGSSHFAQSVRAADIAAMVNLDIVNGSGAVIFGPSSEPGNAAVHDAMARVCGTQQLTCVGMPKYPPSDDHSFQAAGIPNISLAVVAPPEAHQLWLLLNGGKESGLAPDFVPETLHTIHTREDTAARLDPQALALAHRAVLQLLLQLDRDLP